MKDDRLYLIHVQECIDRIKEYTREGRDDFLRDAKTQDAVLRNLQLIGESVKHLPESFLNRHPEIPWARIIGFRNVLVHDYLGIKLDLVWEVIEKFLPKLEKAFDTISDELG